MKLTQQQRTRNKMNFAKLITICMLSLFCMAPTCSGPTPTKNPEGLYQCITVRSSEAPARGTVVEPSGAIIEGFWYTWYEVPIMRVCQSDGCFYKFITLARPEGKGKVMSDSNIATPYQVFHEPVDNLVSRDGRVEACRKHRVFNGRNTDYNRYASEIVERYNTTFGDKTSECTLAILTGPPTCGGL